MALSDRLEGVNFGGNGNNEVGVTVPDIRAYTRETHGFAALGGYQGTGFELSGLGEPAQVNASRLTAGVFLALEYSRNRAEFSQPKKRNTASSWWCLVTERG